MLALRKIQIIVEAGISLSVAKDIVFRMETEEEQHKNKKYDRDFTRILAPLDQQIKSLASSRSNWSKDSARNEVYSAYLELCRKAKVKIQTAARLAKKKNQTISEAAAERGITEFQGRRWSAWVPQHIRTRFLLAFANLPSGRKVTPFLSAMERTSSEKRWDRISTHLATLQAKHANDPSASIHAYIAEAHAVIAARTPTAVAPIQWTHLLSAPRRKAYRKEYKD